METRKSDKKFSKTVRITVGAWMLIIGFVLTDVGTGETQEHAAVTPSDTFAATELAERCLDVLIQAKGIKPPEKLGIPEKGLKPMHVYRMTVACMDLMIELEKKLGIRPMPKVVATPSEYVPEDVRKLDDMLTVEIRRVASALKVNALPDNEGNFPDKTPTDVFKNVLDIFIKLGALAGMEAITPDEVFAQMVRAVSDVKSILIHIDSAQRFRIDAPVSPGEIIPAHVFRECLRIRGDINTLRKHFNMETIPVPEIPEDQVLHPADVFVQTQIILAELNLLKMGTGTVSSTPLEIPVSGKVSRDVHQQALTVRYLLSQVLPLQETVRKVKNEK